MFQLTPDRELALDRKLDPTLEAKIRDAATEFDDSRRRSARKKELVVVSRQKKNAVKCEIFIHLSQYTIVNQ